VGRKPGAARYRRRTAGTTFFWHDHETFGRVPRRDRPVQFAGVRTDMHLNGVAPPVMWYCRPADDMLPDPESCLLTGILPQQALQKGLPEHAIAAAIKHELALPGTIGCGYNSIRFDDEVTRFRPRASSGRGTKTAGRRSASRI